MTDLYLEVNDLIQIHYGEDAVGPGYPGRVEDIIDAGLVVSWPSERGSRLPISIDQRLALSFARMDGLYCLRVTVMERTERPFPRITLKTAGPPSRLQRREYFRVSYPFLVEMRALEVKSGDTDEVPLPGKIHTSNLSGSGFAFNSHVPLPEGLIHEVKLILRGELPAIKFRSKIVRCRTCAVSETDIHFDVGVVFLDISSADRSRIMRHLFDIQLGASNT